MTDNTHSNELVETVASPAEEIVEALFVCSVLESSSVEGLKVTRELPAISMHELVASSTYQDESLTQHMWQKAIDHIDDERTEVEILRSGDDHPTLTEIAAIDFVD